MAIGQNLRGLREGASLTQEQLADKAGVQQSDISKWETNKVTPDLASALKIAAALRCSVDVIAKGLVPQYDKRPDLLRHAKARGSILQQGESGGPASEQSDRISQLETQLKLYRTALTKIANAAGKIKAYASIAHENDHASTNAAGDRRNS